MKRFKITKLDVEDTINSTTIKMNISVYGGVTYAMLGSLRGLIEDGIDYDHGRICVDAERLNEINYKAKYFPNSMHNVTTADIAEAARFGIRRVIFNNTATIVYWGDGTKTVVKCQNGDTFNPETGIAMCFMKKAMGNKSNFNNVFKKFINSEEIKNEGSEESKT